VLALPFISAISLEHRKPCLMNQNPILSNVRLPATFAAKPVPHLPEAERSLSRSSCEDKGGSHAWNPIEVRGGEGSTHPRVLFSREKRKVELLGTNCAAFSKGSKRGSALSLLALSPAPAAFAGWNQELTATRRFGWARVGSLVPLPR